MESIQILGLAAGICTSSSVVPQLVKTIQEKKASDVSWIIQSYHRCLGREKTRWLRSTEANIRRLQ